MAIVLACWSAEGLFFCSPFPAERTWNPLVGIALGGLLAGGLRLVPAVLVGFWGTGFAANSPDLFGLPTAIFSTLQAVVGAALVRAACSRPLALVRFRDIAAFLLAAGPVSCVVAATLRVLTADGSVPTQTVWLRTWAGDALGGLLVTPIVLALFARPADVWRPRIRTVAVPLAVAAVLMTALHHLAVRGDQARSHRKIEQTADALAAGLYAESRRLTTLLATYQTWIGTAGTSAEQQALVRGRTKEFRSLFPAAEDLFAVPEDRPPPEYQEAIDRAAEAKGVGAGPIEGPASGRFAVVVRVDLPLPGTPPGYLGCWVDAKQLIEETRAVPDHHLVAHLVEPSATPADLIPDPAAARARAVTFANRPFRLIVAADAGFARSQATPYTWLALGVTLVAALLSVALLLALTGQTALVRAEVERAAAELSALHRDRAAVGDALHAARRDAALGRLAGGVAHEFNTLFTGILGHAARARDLIPDAHPSQAELWKTEHAVAKASDLCQQILAFTGTGTTVRQPLALHDFLRGVVADVRPRLTPAPEIEIVAASGAIKLTADALLLRRLVTNLLLNAAEAYPQPGGRIVLEYGQATGDLFWLKVTDFGVGMPADVAATAFEPFFSTKGPGRGLGLSAVRGIAATHGGSATVTSTVAGGTTVLVHLADNPIDEGYTPPPAGRSTVVRMSLDLPVELTSGLTLVVDDDATIRELAAAALRGAGCEVLTAENGEEALNLYRRHADRVRLVVLDLLMPVLDGGTTLSRLRADAPTLPVIVMSAYSDFDLTGEFASGSPIALLNKPFRPSELLARAAGFFVSVGCVP